jgi:hypothetical protein
MFQNTHAPVWEGELADLIREDLKTKKAGTSCD